MRFFSKAWAALGVSTAAIGFSLTATFANRGASFCKNTIADPIFELFSTNHTLPELKANFGFTHSPIPLPKIPVSLTDISFILKNYLPVLGDMLEDATPEQVSEICESSIWVVGMILMSMAFLMGSTGIFLYRNHQMNKRLEELELIINNDPSRYTSLDSIVINGDAPQIRRGLSR